MIPSERLQDLFTRLGSYPWWEVLIELAFIWIVVYGTLSFVRGTRAQGALKGLFLILLIATLLARLLGGSGDSFQRLTFLYDRFLTIAAVALIVIFQPELRRALVRLGETPLFRATPSQIVETVDAIASACAYLSKAKFGAIIAIERRVSLAGLVEGGTAIGGEVTAPLLQTIFFPGAALHDLAVVIKGRTVHSAGVQLPLADPDDMADPLLGSRHRAAVGLTKECDALVVVVSEETGNIRIAERGRLSEPLERSRLRDELLRRLRQDAAPREEPAEEGFQGDGNDKPPDAPSSTGRERKDAESSQATR